MAATRMMNATMNRPIDRTNAPLAGVAILLVEVDPEARRRAAAALEGWGAIVVGVSSAQEARGAFQSVIPTVVVTDLELPGLDGTWLLRQIRELPADKGGRVPVVAFSASSESRERIRAAGFHDLIGKPIDPFELCARITWTLS
jgi:CheY-like chemotaxis protein